MSLKKPQYGEQHPLLSGYPFKANFIEIEGIKIHYIVEENLGFPTVLLLHGVPGWSYTYRHIIPVCIAEGLEVVAPDLPGFGKSEKPTDKQYYTLERLATVVEGFILKLNLKSPFLFCHDWGAIIGMVLAARNPSHFSGVIVSNGYLPVAGQKIPVSFRFWQWFTKYSPIIPVGKIVSFGTRRKLSREEQAGYDYPFINEKEKIAIRALPDQIRKILSEKEKPSLESYWNELKKFEKPFLTVFSSNDPISRGGEKLIQALIPGAKDQPHRIMKGGHFLQEDAPSELGFEINGFVNRNL